MRETKEININMNQVTRIEGHANIIVQAKNGTVEKIEWQVSESPRLFEAMLVGRHYADVPYIASRICGICSIAHTTASIQAVEAAFGIRPSEQTLLLRKLLYNAEILESHVLHTLFLVAPDFLGVDSVFPLVNTHRDVVVLAMNLKRLAYNLAELLAERKTHPLSCVVGGFAKFPEVKQLKEMRKRLRAGLKDMDTVVELFASLLDKVPPFERETEYIALKDRKEYAFISGDIASSDMEQPVPKEEYLSVTNEFCVPQSTAKWTKNRRSSYMVGALSRFNLNYNQLLPQAKRVARELSITAPAHNPFLISVAQVVETVHAFEDSLDIIDRLVARGIKEEEPRVRVRPGRGIGVVEAPRGILFHDYTFNEKGICMKANCIIPTNQNHNNIQKDMEALVPKMLQENRSEKDIQFTLEMLARAYDPCVSCSTHMVRLELK